MVSSTNVVALERAAKRSPTPVSGKVTNRKANDALRTRSHLTEAEVTKLLKVDKKGPAAEKGIRPGDIIVEISQQEVTGPADVEKKVAEAKKAGRKSVLLLLEGKGGLRFVAIRIAKG